ncbi:MAG: ATP-binding protein, partial [Acidobacteria bacterium]|nr:ATP-binding protein [Acidobacteriota bacterium]
MSAPLNPYVGAVPLGKENPIFGRDREIRELQYLLTAERVVLLYSPSGAGKSSLVRAKNGVANRLRENFDVWPVARVQDEPPAGARNRYIWSAARYWESELPEARRRSDEALGQLSLQEIVKKRPRRKDAPASTLLIFDQFEELVRLNPVDLDAKREFFEELGELLSDPSIWALFVLREDYLAAFDPYARCVPTHFRHRFRLDLLTVEAAKLAIAKPAGGERQWHPDAVDRLVDELSQVRVQPLEGESYKVPGAYVEPMHLQVVCQEIWRTMPPDDNMVDVKDLGDFGDVDKVLGRYYESAIGEGRPFAEARAMRNWMGTRLITAGQVRGQVMRRPKESDGLRNDLIEELVSMHLVRAEQRGGSVWFELAHDRLIEPVLANNRQWFAANLSELERRAELWEQNGKSRDLLASGLAYWRMRQWKGRNPERCGLMETEFLAESWSKVTGSFWRWGTTAAAVVAALVAMVARQEAVVLKDEAVRLRDDAQATTKALVRSEGDLKATFGELKTKSTDLEKKSGELKGQLERNEGLLRDLRATAHKERLAREESQKELGMRVAAEKQSA